MTAMAVTREIDTSTFKNKANDCACKYYAVSANTYAALGSLAISSLVSNTSEPLPLSTPTQ